MKKSKYFVFEEGTLEPVYKVKISGEVAKLYTLGAPWTQHMRNKHLCTLIDGEDKIVIGIHKPGKKVETLTIDICDLADLRVLLEVVNRKASCVRWFTRNRISEIKSK